jgi:Holliday junction resolvase
MTINSRQKGARGEREFAENLRSLGFDARRGQQFSGSPDSPDVITNIPGVHFEVKRVERGSLYAWLAQAQKDAGAGQIPVVAHRRNNGGWIAILPMGHLLELLRGRAADLRQLPEDATAAPEKGDGGSARKVVAPGRRRAPRSRVQ